MKPNERKKAMLPLTLLLLSAFLLMPLSMSAQVGVRLDGGVSMPVGGAAGSTVSPVAPYGSAGVFYNVGPRFRAGADYNYTMFSSASLSGKLEPLAGGGQAGDVYKSVKNHMHGLGATAEYDVIPAGPVSLYVGAGAGCLLSQVNTYTLGVRNEVKTTGNSVSFTGHNEGSRQVSMYVPATVSLEFSFLPQVAVSLGGGYRFVFAGKKELSPKGQAFATLGLRFNLK